MTGYSLIDLCGMAGFALLVVAAIVAVAHRLAHPAGISPQDPYYDLMSGKTAKDLEEISSQLKG